MEGMHKFSSDKSQSFVTVCGLVCFFFSFLSMNSPKFPHPYLTREIGVSRGRFEVAWLGVMECQGGHGYFPGAANNFKFSLGVMPGWRDFSSTETHGWLLLDFQLSAGTPHLGDALALLVEQESQAQNQSWLAGGVCF